MNLLLLFPSDITEDGRYRVTGARFEHLRGLFGATKGDRFRVGLLNGPIGTGAVTKITDDYALILADDLHEIHPPYDITVICAIPRPKILRRVLYVAAMTGVRSLLLIRTNRTDKSYLSSPILQRLGFEPYLLDGLSQGGHTRIPAVSVHHLFRPFVEDELPELEHDSSSPKLLADLVTADRIDQILPGKFRHATVAIGPEGGWVPFERDLLIEAGFRPFSLGESVLRVEYAVSAALAQIDLAWRQL